MIFTGKVPVTENMKSIADAASRRIDIIEKLPPDPEAEKIFNSPTWIGKGEPFHVQNPSVQPSKLNEK